ncbi:MAG: anhydro-N-acetylmuramic acid kinase [Verrucomicrobia bacterium]|nr:anhydro-N-acetylmuramic acid kinase [Verrucomicrobiota bacterium]
MSAVTSKHPTLVLGIMSGTSIDSVDYALCAVTETSVMLWRHWQVGFPAALRRRLHGAARGAASAWELGQLHHDLGRFYATGAKEGPRQPRPALVGLHGQTVFHHPDPRSPATLQIGEPAWLVEALRVPVVANFRSADLAAGGQGAPLATQFHRVAFACPGEFVCVNNLGGISNVTALDWRRGREPRVQAFDTGPANVLLDLALRHFTRGRWHFDRGGAWAARGRVAEGLVERWLAHPFFRMRPPKSTGRELFGEPFWRDALAASVRAKLTRYDLVATLTEFTARSVALNYRLHLGGMPTRVILTGGGAANPQLLNRIAHQLRAWNGRIRVLSSDEVGWPLQAIEAAAFALLAFYRWRGLPGNIPSTTGARRAAMLGQLCRP